MGRFIERVQLFAAALGAPGLFIITLLDSSVLSLPEIADLLVISMVIQHPARLVLYASSATLGSIAGCLLLYVIGRKGGDAIVRKRFKAETVDKALGAFKRFGIMAVLIPSILPPPAPFKIFVLLAGVANVGIVPFSIAIAIGRGARYFAEGLLAVWYGKQAMTFISENATTVSLAAVAVLVAGLVGYVLISKRARKEP